MDKEDQIPDKRFENYEQIYDKKGVAIGFTLPGVDFIFKFNSDGGWKDEKGNQYNSKGVLMKKQDPESDEDEGDSANSSIDDQFERMLEQEQQGISKTKNKPQKNIQKPIKQAETYLPQTVKLIQKYKNKQNVRVGLPEELHIFFKMRTKFYERISPKVQYTQSVNEANVEIKKIKQQAQQKTKQLRQKNSWIGDGQLQYSGAQLGESIYDRYWYGLVRATPQNYKQVLQSIQKSEQFALLQNKSFYNLKSKFYLKKKMEATINELGKILEGKEDDDLIKIQISNLPQNFPSSFILDLCIFSGTPLQQIYSIDLIDELGADIIISKRGATKFLNVQGYCHDENQYIELNLVEDKQKRKIVKTKMYKIKVETDKQNPYKPHIRQLHEALALQKSRDEFVKLYSAEQEKQNGGFRFIVGSGVLRRVLMFRGNSLDVLKVQLFQK